MDAHCKNEDPENRQNSESCNQLVSLQFDVSQSYPYRISADLVSNSKFLNSGRSWCKEGNESLDRADHLLGMTTRMQGTTRPT